jgi:hypothetical protein
MRSCSIVSLIIFYLCLLMINGEIRYHPKEPSQDHDKPSMRTFVKACKEACPDYCSKKLCDGDDDPGVVRFGDTSYECLCPEPWKK